MWRFASLAAIAFAFTGLATAATGADPPLEVSLVSCDARAHQANVPANRALVLVGPMWSAKTRGLIVDFLHGSTTQATIGTQTIANAVADYSAPAQRPDGIWATTWRHPVAALPAGVSLGVQIVVSLDHQIPDPLGVGHPAHLGPGTVRELRCTLHSTIGPAGGTLSQGGATVVIPPGALSQETAITAALTTAAPPATLGTVVGAGFDLEPSGTTFAAPVTITLAFDPVRLGSLPASSVRLATQSSGAWIVLASRVDPVAHTVSADVTHFTPYAPIVPQGISGTIRDLAGNTVAGAVVAPATFSGGTCTEIASAETSTDATGAYFINIGAGTYKVVARRLTPLSAPMLFGNVPACDFSPDVVVGAGTTPGIDITVGNDFIWGFVSDQASSVRIAGVTVTAHQGPAAVTSATSDANGIFFLRLTDGTYTVFLQPPAGTLWRPAWFDNATSQGAATPITLSANNQLISTTLLREGIAGHVQDALSGAAIASATIRVYDGSGAVAATTATSASGDYSVFVVDGTYRVSAAKAGFGTRFFNGKTSLASADGVLVSGAVATANLALPPVFTLSGTITDATSGAGVADASVRISDALCVGVVATAQPGAGGAYGASLEAASYKVFIDGGATHASKWHGGTTCASAATVALSANTTLNETLLPLPVGFSGTVKDAPGSAVAGAAVRAYVGGSNHCCSLAMSTTTAADGSFSLTPVAGTYRIEILPPAGSGLFERWAGGNNRFINAADYTLGATPVKLADIVLPSGAHTISGRVTDVAGNGLGSSWLESISTTSPSGLPTDRGWTIADTSGNYRLTVPSDIWVVIAVPPPGHQISSRGGIDSSTNPLGVNIACPDGLIISGRATDRLSAAGIASIHVFADLSSTSVPVSEDFTDTAGNYALTVADGSYVLGFETFEGVTYPRLGYVRQFWNNKPTQATADTIVTGGANAPGKDAALDPLFAISGSISATTSPGPAFIRVEAHAANATCDAVFLGNVALAVFMKPDGTYTLIVPNGSYTILFTGNADWNDQFFNGAATCAAATPVTVSGADVAGINALLTHK